MDSNKLKIVYFTSTAGAAVLNKRWSDVYRRWFCSICNDTERPSRSLLKRKSCELRGQPHFRQIVHLSVLRTRSLRWNNTSQKELNKEINQNHQIVSFEFGLVFLEILPFDCLTQWWVSSVFVTSFFSSERSNRINEILITVFYLLDNYESENLIFS